MRVTTTKQRDVVMTFYNKNVAKEGKVCFGTGMINKDSLTPEEQNLGSGSNLYLINQLQQGKVDKNGKPMYNHQTAFSAEQRDKIRAAAGPNVQAITDPETGKEVGFTASIKCDLMTPKGGGGFMPNTAGPMEPGPEIGPDVRKEHAAFMHQTFRENMAKKAAEAEKAPAGPAMEQTAEAPVMDEEAQMGV